MRNKIKNVALLVIGMFLGASLFGGVAYAATGVLAERSTNRVFVDGREVEVDYSAQANPSVFSGVYTREAYNAAYTVLAGLRNGDETVTAPLCIGFQEDRWKLENMLGNLSNGYTLSLRGIEGKGMYEIYVVKPDREIARQYTAGLITEVNALMPQMAFAESIEDYGGNVNVMIRSQPPHEYLDVNRGGTTIPLSGRIWSYITADGKMEGPAYCIKHGSGYPNGYLPVNTSPYTANPAMTAAFASGYPIVSLADFTASFSDVVGLTEMNTGTRHSWRSGPPSASSPWKGPPSPAARKP